MMNGLYYLLEANLYLAVFYGFYRLFLHKETFYTLNRYFLLSATLVAFVLPLLQFGYLYNLIGWHTDTASNTILNREENIQQGFTISMLIVYMYVAVAAVYLSKLMLNLYQIFARSGQSIKSKIDDITYVELQGTEPAFSFFNLLFINPDTKDKNTVIKHEMVHIRQKHSVDIIFFEIIQILSWFNPITYFIKKDIKLLHEYIADDATVHTIQKHEYAMFLIKNSFGVAPGQLTNQMFNQSILKMRINMLNKERSAGRARLKILLIAPIIGVMLCTSTIAFTKDYATVDLYPEKYRSNKINDQVTPPPPPVEPAAKKVVKFPPPIVKDNPNTAKNKSAANKKNNPKVSKQKGVKFPPPTIRENTKKTPQKDQIKFPPPIVKPDKQVKSQPAVNLKGKISGKKVDTKELPPPPPVEPKADNQ